MSAVLEPVSALPTGECIEITPRHTRNFDVHADKTLAALSQQPVDETEPPIDPFDGLPRLEPTPQELDKLAAAAKALREAAEALDAASKAEAAANTRASQVEPLQRRRGQLAADAALGEAGAIEALKRCTEELEQAETSRIAAQALRERTAIAARELSNQRARLRVLTIDTTAAVARRAALRFVEVAAELRESLAVMEAVERMLPPQSAEQLFAGHNILRQQLSVPAPASGLLPRCPGAETLSFRSMLLGGEHSLQRGAVARRSLELTRALDAAIGGDVHRLLA